MSMNKIDVLLGLQWGDEGKGKIVDALTPDYDLITRLQSRRSSMVLYSVALLTL